MKNQNQNQNQNLSKKSKSTFNEGEALASEAGNMLNGMMAGATRSLVPTKAFWGLIGLALVSLGGTVWFAIWAVQTIAAAL